MSDLKPPDGYDSWLDMLLYRSQYGSVVKETTEKAHAELAALRADAERWRAYKGQDDDRRGNDGPPDIRSPTYRQDMEAFIKRQLPAKADGHA